MGLAGVIGNLLQQYAGSAAASPAAVDQHFDQAAQGIDKLVPRLGNRFDDAFGGHSPHSDKSCHSCFKTETAIRRRACSMPSFQAEPPAVLSQLSALIPGLGTGGTISSSQAQAIPADTVTQIAASAEQHDPSIVDKMSSRVRRASDSN